MATNKAACAATGIKVDKKLDTDEDVLVLELGFEDDDYGYTK